MTIRLRVRELMEERELTQREMSDLTGLSTVTISRLYNDHSQMLRFTTLQTICDSFDVTPAEVIEYERDR